MIGRETQYSVILYNIYLWWIDLRILGQKY